MHFQQQIDEMAKNPLDESVFQFKSVGVGC